MLIQGSYRNLGHNRPPAPYVRAFVLLEGMATGEMVDFLVDTGADTTTLHPRDLQLLKVSHSILDFNTRLTAIGIGGGQTI